MINIWMRLKKQLTYRINFTYMKEKNNEILIAFKIDENVDDELRKYIASQPRGTKKKDVVQQAIVEFLEKQGIKVE